LNFELRVDRLEKKIEAGSDFIQTQSVFNVDKFMTWMDEVKARGLDKKVHILAGITPLKSLKMTEKHATDPKQEGYKIALELINELKHINGIHGIHITALFWEDIIPSLIKESGLSSQP